LAPPVDLTSATDLLEGLLGFQEVIRRIRLCFSMLYTSSEALAGARNEGKKKIKKKFSWLKNVIVQES
jgi:hypothetical protein